MAPRCSSFCLGFYAIPILLLVCWSVKNANSQVEDCTDFPSDSALESLISNTFSQSDSSTPTITVVEVNYVCLSSGIFRGTYSGFSAVVLYECTDSQCPNSNVSQFDFSCHNGEWMNDVLGTSENARTDVADTNLTSPNRTDCSICLSPTHAALRNASQLLSIYDNFNHCLSCSSGCYLQGDMKCFDFGNDSCCNFYNPLDNWRCLSDCPAGRDTNDKFECTGGTITILGNVTFDPILRTLTCVSTGGVATSVTWTRDSTIITEGNLTVLDDVVTAQYTYTLSVTTQGEYICTVSNNKPSTASATILLGPSNLTAIQNGPRSITVTWTPPSQLVGVTGYRISYNGEGSNDVVTIDGSNNNYTLSGLRNGKTYRISLVASSTILTSETFLAKPVPLVPFSAIILDTFPVATSYTITISSSSVVTDGSVVTGFVIEWLRNTSVGCSNRDEGGATVLVDTLSQYTITGLEPGNMYIITVRPFNAAGVGPLSNAVMTETAETYPTRNPSSVRVREVTVNSVTVQWDEVPCLDRNGEIILYRIRALRDGHLFEGYATVPGYVREVTIHGLSPSSMYTVQVAAVNNAGTGTYGTGVDTTTSDGLTTHATVSTTSVTLSWTVNNQFSANAYTVFYCSRNTACYCYSNIIFYIHSSVLAYTLTGLEEGTDYTITTIARLSGGWREQDTINITTLTSTPSAPPSSVRVLEQNSTDITLTWGTVPCIHQNGEITGYLVRYETVETGSQQTVNLTGANSNEVTLSGLTPATRYKVDVTAVNSAGAGVRMNLSVTTLPGAPEMFAAVARERDVVFSWFPPPNNGVGIRYTLSCSPSPSSLPQTYYSHSISLVVTGFSPNTDYSCTLVTRNTQGSGLPATASFTTQRDYSYFQIRLSDVVGCSEWVVSSTDRKLRDVTNAVVHRLEPCTECNNESFDIIFFVCFPQSPSSVTYRARLEGTSEMDSGSLISVIEKWVRGGGASVNVSGVLLKVDSDCSVAISSLGQPECYPTSSPPAIESTFSDEAVSDSVIGGVVAVVIILVIAITIAIITTIVCVVLKHRSRGLSKSTTHQRYSSSAIGKGAVDKLINK